jgi:hypothetical protein
MKFQRFHGPATALLGVFTLLGAATLIADDHTPLAPHGIELSWAGGEPAGSFYAELAEPVVSLRLVNRDRVGYTVLARTLEDAGSLQTRRTGSPATVTLAAGGEQELAIRFGGGDLERLTHSGMVTVVVEACPSQGGRCTGGTSYPLFFHGKAGRVLVHGERVLCERFRCGDLSGTAEIERGTWRALGGGPLHGVIADDEAAVTGGVQ